MIQRSPTWFWKLAWSKRQEMSEANAVSKGWVRRVHTATPQARNCSYHEARSSSKNDLSPWHCRDPRRTLFANLHAGYQPFNMSTGSITKAPPGTLPRICGRPTPFAKTTNVGSVMGCISSGIGSLILFTTSWSNQTSNRLDTMVTHSAEVQRTLRPGQDGQMKKLKTLGRQKSDSYNLYTAQNDVRPLKLASTVSRNFCSTSTADPLSK